MPKVGIDQIATENSTINGKKGSFSNPIIPKGFKAINEGKAIWTETNGYTNGLVIEDATSDIITRESQFVWVPVQNYDNFILREGYQKGYLDRMLSYGDNPSREAGASKTELLPGKPNVANTVLRNR